MLHTGFCSCVALAMGVSAGTQKLGSSLFLPATILLTLCESLLLPATAAAPRITRATPTVSKQRDDIPYCCQLLQILELQSDVDSVKTEMIFLTAASYCSSYNNKSDANSVKTER